MASKVPAPLVSFSVGKICDWNGIDAPLIRWHYRQNDGELCMVPMVILYKISHWIEKYWKSEMSKGKHLCYQLLMGSPRKGTKCVLSELKEVVNQQYNLQDHWHVNLRTAKD